MTTKEKSGKLLKDHLNKLRPDAVTFPAPSIANNLKNFSQSTPASPNLLSSSPSVSDPQANIRPRPNKGSSDESVDSPGSSKSSMDHIPRLNRSKAGSTSTVPEQAKVSPSGAILSFAESKARKSNGSLSSLKGKQKQSGFVMELSVKPEEDGSNLLDGAEMALEDMHQPRVIRQRSIMSNSSGQSSDRSINEQMSSPDLGASHKSNIQRQLSIDEEGEDGHGFKQLNEASSPGASPSGSILSFGEAKARKSSNPGPAKPAFELELSIKPELDEEEDLISTAHDSKADRPKTAGAKQIRRLSVLQEKSTPGTPPQERPKRMSLAGLQSKLAASRPSATNSQQISASTKTRLRTIMSGYTIGLRLQHSITIRMKSMLNTVRGVSKPATTNDQPSLSSILTSLSQSPTAYIPTVIRTLLTAPVRDIPQIVSVLNQHVKDFNTFSKAEQTHLAKHLRYDIISPDQVLLWEEHLATCFYFILTGQIEVFKNNNGKLLKLACMSKGAFGHGRIKVDYARRSAAAYSIGTSIVLTIERDDYLSMKIEDLDPRLALLDGLPVFKESGDKLKRFFKVQEFANNGVLQKEGDLVNRVYWVLEGNLKVIQSVPIIRKTGTSVIEKAWSGSALGENESKIMVELETANLSFGNCFNSLIPCGPNQSTVKYLGHDYIDKKAFVDFYSSTNDDVSLASPYTITSNGMSVVASLAMEELCDFLSKELIYQLTFKSDVAVYSIKELQEKYLADQAWEAMKKDNMKKSAKKNK